MDGILARLPGDAPHRRLLAEVAALVPEMAARAAEHDQAANFPSADIAALRATGALIAVVPMSEGGLAWAPNPTVQRRWLNFYGCWAVAIWSSVDYSRPM